MTTTTLTEKAIAVTGLPEDARDFFIAMHNMLAFSTETPGKLKMKGDYIQLPEGNWTILGRADELTEEQWKMVVKFVGLPWCAYKDYTTDKSWHSSAIPSGHSLLKAKGLHVTNPLMSEKPITVIGHKGQEKICELILKKFQEQWQSAELLTNPLILIQ